MQKKLFGISLNRILLILIGLIILAVIATSLRKNIHVVIPNQVYRSAQLSSSSLSLLVKSNKIHSIINLRGKNPQFKWYRQEIKTSKLLGVQHYDIALSAEKLPSKAQIQRLVFLIQHASRPILFHCESGADRTGLASAMALTIIKNEPISTAKQAFSWRYFVTSHNSVGKVVFRRYQSWLQNTAKKANRSNFLLWINNAYPNKH